MNKFFTVILILLIGSPSYGESLIPCGLAVMNIHEKNSNLEGFAIQQHPDWDKETKIYEKGHPYITAVP